jgi:hypothetical protein
MSFPATSSPRRISPQAVANPPSLSGCGGYLRESTLKLGQTISGLPEALWTEANHRPQLLHGSPNLTELRTQGPGLPMAPFIGERIAEEQLYDEDRFSGDEEVSALRHVFAYPVLTLISQSITIDQPEDIGPTLRQLLARQLPDIDWWVPDGWSGPFVKYAIIHASIPAPPSQGSGEPMALELFGEVSHVTAFDISTQQGSELFSEWVLRNRRRVWGQEDPEEATTFIPSPGRITITLRAATYSNLQYPGVGVPLYI